MRTSKNPNKKVFNRLLPFVCGLFLVSGCAVTPEPIEEPADVDAIIGALFEGQEPIETELSLSDVMARAISYNIDHRVSMMEEALSNADLDVANMGMLPRITAQAGYYSRSNESASSSQSVISGTESLEPSRSSDTSGYNADATLVWNILDFGVSYIAAQQTSDEVMIAQERRRKALQNIMQDVREKYWSAYNMQNSVEQTDALISSTENALTRSKELSEQGLINPSDALFYQQELLSTLRELWQMRQEMAIAEIDLAQLINALPGEKIVLKPTEDELLTPILDKDLSELEQFALTNRPELREEDYRARISTKEVKTAMLRMLPGIEIELGTAYDDNPFLVNDSWNTTGIRLSWNLFNLFAGPAYKRQAEANLMLDTTRRLAMSMAVLTQVNVAAERYYAAVEDFELTEDSSDVALRIGNYLRAQQIAEVTNELITVRSQMEGLVTRLQRDEAFAEMQNALGRIHNSIGLDPVPDEVTALDISTLSEAIASHQKKLNSDLESVIQAASL